MQPKQMVECRTKLMLSEQRLAEYLGVTRQAIVFWEQGKRKIPPPVVKLILLWVKYPQLMNESRDIEKSLKTG